MAKAFSKLSEGAGVKDTKPKISDDKITPEKSKTGFKTTMDTTGRKSVEVSFFQLIMKDYMKNLTKSFKNVYERLNEVMMYFYPIDRGLLL
jgi:hypothetical protein